MGFHAPQMGLAKDAEILSPGGIRTHFFTVKG